MINMYRTVLIFAVAACITMFAGCGGHGHGNSGDNPPGTASPTKAVVVFSSLLPTGSQEKIASIDLTLELPPGVTLGNLPPGNVPTGTSGVLAFSGEGLLFSALPTANAVIYGNYTPPAPAANASVKITVLTLTGSGLAMNPGEFATIIFDLSPGLTISAADFKPLTTLLIGNASGVKLFDSLTAITGPASVSYTVTFK